MFSFKNEGDRQVIETPSHDALNSIYVSSWDNFHNMAKFATGSTSEVISDSILSAMSTGSNLDSCLDYHAEKKYFPKVLSKKNTSEIFAIELFGKDPGLHNDMVD